MSVQESRTEGRDVTLQGWSAAWFRLVEWECETVAHLSSPDPCSCELHQQWSASQTAAPARRPNVRKVTAADIEARIARNAEALAATDIRLADFLRRNASRNDPAVINLAHSKRPGALTDRRVEQWSRLTARRESLRHRLALDGARLARIGRVA